MCLLTVVIFFFVGCDDNGSSSRSVKPKPVPGVAVMIDLMIHPVGTGEEPQPRSMRGEGDVYIDLGDSVVATDYFVYARSENYYTELYYCNKGDLITVDLDSVAGPSRTMTGTIFSQQVYGFDSYYTNKTMILNGPNNLSISVTTDEQGRFGIGALPVGDYTLEFTVQGESKVLSLNNSNAMDYLDLSFFEPTQVDAPNIYLYPETESDISVTLDFPNGGHVKVSDPPYNDGWNVTVTPDGIIEGEYDYLFYKAILPTQPNANEGWLLTTANLETEFRVLLAEQGFVGREIDDFIDYWIPLLDDAPYYGVFPQDVESFVGLNVVPSPENTLRVFLLVLPFEQPVIIPIPRENNYITRDGFTVVEWGVFVPYLH